jgi:hypothetical protein
VIDRILRVATGSTAAVSVAALALGGTLLFRLSPYEALKSRLDGASLPEETITPPDQFAATLEALGVAGREAYLQFQLWDVLNPVLIGVAGAMLLGWLLKRGERAGSAWRFVLVLPVALLTADLLENSIIAIGISAYPEPTALGMALPIVTAAKFGAAMVTVVAMVLLALMWLRDGVSGSSRRAT